MGTTGTKAGYKLPEYYLAYYLLVELLEFRHGGRGAKVAWTIPVEYDPESCAGSRKAAREALTGEHAGRVIEP
jgi:hypothetical protein